MAERRTARGRVLVVEDEDYVRTSLEEVLRARGFDVDLAESEADCFRALDRTPVDVVLTDLKLRERDGLDVVRRVRASYPDLPVLVLTGHGTIQSAVACIKAGASEYILKPADPAALELALDRALAARSLRREVERLRTEGEGGVSAAVPVGRTDAWLRVVENARAAGATESPVLLLGESGTGKELLARLVHRASPRAGQAYVSVNCAAVPVDMWESEFFGHRRGSFTGAAADREGRFRMAHGGTLFMDEVGSMPLPAQAKILRVLQDGEFYRLGDERPTRVDVRIVAATNADLDAEVAAGTFRNDLFYRLDVARIVVPPLRERRDDVPLLAAHFVSEIAARLGRPVPRIEGDVVRDLMAYPWPGNVRELRNVLERALIFTAGDVLSTLDLPPVEGHAAPAEGAAGHDLHLRTRLAERERELIVEALRRAGASRKEASRLLGIDQRNLPYYLRKHGIDPDAPDGP
jgi:DNA-binding NtrC family response regulator